METGSSIDSWNGMTSSDGLVTQLIRNLFTVTPHRHHRISITLSPLLRLSGHVLILPEFSEIQADLLVGKWRKVSCCVRSKNFLMYWNSSLLVSKIFYFNSQNWIFLFYVSDFLLYFFNTLHLPCALKSCPCALYRIKSN
jgi:hypothetical protein